MLVVILFAYAKYIILYEDNIHIWTVATKFCYYNSSCLGH